MINLSSSHAACLLSVRVPGRIYAVGVEVLAVVVRGVLMSVRLCRLATDFDKRAWVCVHPIEELRSELLVDGEVW